MRVEVRATGLRGLRQKRGVAQRQLGRDLGISQNYIPAIESGARHAGPKLQQQMAQDFGCGFEDLFEVVLVDPETKREQILAPRRP
jgi:transcriptional regulator with XRE-family HTH domain